jgi:tetratricopeptide (TPR) repeat protein
MPEPPDAASAGTLQEEPLPSEAASETAPNQPADGALVPAEPPALADTIDAGTAPNVAAATRLVDAGRAQMAAGDDGAALEQLERAIAIDPANAYAYYYLAELHFSNRTYDQAIAFADRAANLSDTRAPEWASRAYTLQGNAFEAIGRFGDAHDAYARALEAAPGNLAAQVGLSRVGGAAAPAP